MLARLVSNSSPCDPLALASQSAGITGVSYRTRPAGYYSNSNELTQPDSGRCDSNPNHSDSRVLDLNPHNVSAVTKSSIPQAVSEIGRLQGKGRRMDILSRRPSIPHTGLAQGQLRRGSAI